MKLTVTTTKNESVLVDTKTCEYAMVDERGHLHTHGRYADIPAVLSPGMPLVFGTIAGEVEDLGTVARVRYES